MQEPKLLDLGTGERIILVDMNYEFEITKCKAGNDCKTYKKKAYELDQSEIDLIKGELIKKEQMENNMPYYVTYKFHDTKGRRLAIFAVPSYREGLYQGVSLREQMPFNLLKIFIITCSKKDTFSKARARNMFAEFMQFKMQGFTGSYAHPTEIQIDVKDDKPKFTFLRWCEDNYFKYIPTVFALEAPMLYRGDELLDGRFPTFKIMEIRDADSIPQTTTEN